LLDANGLGHRYTASGPWLFRNLDLSLTPGEVLSVLGPNARGKTTLLTCLAGVRVPKEGRVESHGGVGYVPQAQQAEHTFPVHEMVVMGRAAQIRAWSTPSAEDEEIAWRALERVGMADIGDRPFNTLSGGQRQLVLIARALVCDPAVLILDEPTSALDLRNQRRVLTVIRDLAEQGMGVLFTTHDPTHALHVSHRTLVMDEEIRLGPTPDLLTAPVLSRLYRTPVRTTQVEFADAIRTVVAPDLLASEESVPDAGALPDSRISTAATEGAR
jgi:iron complex transport system ATP-binding protein